MILPVRAPSFCEALRYGVEVFHRLETTLADISTAVDNEDGFAPNLGSNEEVLGIILQAIENAGTKSAATSTSAWTAPSSEFFRDGSYNLKAEKRRFSSAEFTRCLADLAGKYPIVSVEDGMAEGTGTAGRSSPVRSARSTSSSATTSSSRT